MKKLAIVVTAAALAGCAANSQEKEPKLIGMPNPASGYCIEKGGELVKVTTAKGDSYDCVLPSGERIDEWDLFRRDHR